MVSSESAIKTPAPCKAIDGLRQGSTKKGEGKAADAASKEYSLTINFSSDKRLGKENTLLKTGMRTGCRPEEGGPFSTQKMKKMLSYPG